MSLPDTGRDDIASATSIHSHLQVTIDKRAVKRLKDHLPPEG